MALKHKLMGLAVTLSLIGPTAAFAQGKGETIKIQDYPGLGNMLVRVAIAKGYCTNRGLKCETQMLPSGPLGVQALLAKSIDVAFGPLEVQTTAVARGAQLKAIAGGAVPVTAILIARTDGSLEGSDKPFPGYVPGLKGKNRYSSTMVLANSFSHICFTWASAFALSVSFTSTSIYFPTRTLPAFLNPSESSACSIAFP